VLVRQSGFCQSNAVIVRGDDGLLLIDPGVTGDEMAELADEIAGLGQRVVAGFSTHPHWDHLLWHARLGDVPRWATAIGARVAQQRLDDARRKAANSAPGAPLDRLGDVTPLAASRVPWRGPTVRVVEHRGHAPGHAALLIEDHAVLVAGDMLSDVEIPLLDLDADDPLGDYEDALRVLEQVCASVSTVVPGHGALARGDEIADRFREDRAYLAALRAGRDTRDARIDADYGRDWLPGEHRRQVARTSSLCPTRQLAAECRAARAALT
jgi:glyoxylase-like metal-dependent hydrolase (beta-lactamase superfamily II)